MKMIKILTILCLSVFTLQAQDIISKLGGNTANETYDVTDSGDNLLFRVQGDAGALFLGTYNGTGVIPATGSGTRMMWYPKKGAFRAGYVTGTQWDNGSIGNFSTAMGDSTKAESYASVAFGKFNVGGRTTSSWVTTDPLFEIGIGTDSGNKANALTVLKNGNVGIGTVTPGAKLSIVGLSEYADNAAASSGGLIAGDLYRTGDLLKIVH